MSSIHGKDIVNHYITTGNVKAPNDPSFIDASKDKNNVFTKLFDKGHDSDLSQKMHAYFGIGGNVNNLT